MNRSHYIALLNMSESKTRRLQENSLRIRLNHDDRPTHNPPESNPAIAIATPKRMPTFTYSARSKAHLATCHPALIRLMEYVLEVYDHVIIEGHRGKEAQNEAFESGHSKVRWPDGKHNKNPSIAVDAAPYDPVLNGVNWNTDHRTREGRANLLRFYHFAGIVQGIGYRVNIPVRWGGDWNTNTHFDDQTFNDLVHFELLNP